MNIRTLNLINHDLYRQLDKAVLGGLGFAVALIFVATFASGSASLFLSPSSLALVLGGTFGAGLINFSLNDMSRAWVALKSVLFTREHNPIQRIEELVRMAQRVRREGLLILEEEANNTDDRFLKAGLELAVDGQESQEIKRILENEIKTCNDIERRAIQVFQSLASYAPAFGLIGTLIGLVQMLGVLNDPTKVGPAMSLALITTLYGAILANLVFLPVAGKLKIRSEEETLVKQISVEGILALARQDNPIVIEQKLQSFLPA